MYPITRWLKKSYLLTVVGVKASHVFLVALTASRPRRWMKGTQHVPPHGVYKEQAFRELLTRESLRSERSGHLCQTLLVYRTNTQGEIVPMEPAIARRVIEVLSRRLRDTDYIGWYREERIVGGILTVMGRDSVGQGGHGLGSRLSEILRKELALGENHHVQIRVYQHDEVKEFELI